MRSLFVAITVLLVADSVTAQVQNRPTDPPIVTAENDSWYRLGEPLQFTGDLYFRAGAVVFFNGNTMVRTGHYNGVPLYADTTIEPYSIVYVPIGRGLMQPYEKVRTGALAGTSGSRTPSFPTQRAPGGALIPHAPVAPTSAPQPIGAISAFTPETGAVGTAGRPAPPVRAAAASGAVGTTGIAAAQRAAPLVSIRRPENNDGIWVLYRGQKWVSAGAVVPLSGTEFVLSGDYAGFPVYTKRGSEDTIYLPITPTAVGPYRLKR